MLQIGLRMILANGLIRTLDFQVPTQRALAVAGEWIAGGVGVHETALASPEVLDLSGRVVLPGLTAFVSDLPGAEDVDSLRTAVRSLNARGVTAVHDFGEHLELWQLLAERGSLTVRVWQTLPSSFLPELQRLGLRSGFGGPFLRIGFPRTSGAAEDLDPLAGVRRAVREGTASIEEAFESACVAPARLTGEERRRGTLIPGRAADLVVFDRDPWEDIEAEAVATMVAGRWVHNPPPWD
jgi:predicted amidohydrolase YtcJ